MAQRATINKYPLDGTDYEITFEFLARKFIVVTLSNDAGEELNLVNGESYRWLDKTKIRLLSIPAGYNTISIIRRTSATDRLVSFVNGSILRDRELNIAQIQALHIAEEGRDQSVELTSMYAEQARESAIESKDSATHSKAEADRVDALIASAGDKATLIVLGGADGATYIGGVIGLNKLATIKPREANLSIRLLTTASTIVERVVGDGLFVSVVGEKPKVPGHVIPVVGSGFSWVRQCSQVVTSNTGLVRSARADVSALASGIVDVADDMQKVIDYALTYKMELHDDSFDAENPGYAQWGWYITKAVRLHSETVLPNGRTKCVGLARVSGSFSWLLNSNAFTGVSLGGKSYALTLRSGEFNAAGSYYYGTMASSTVMDRMTIRDCGSRAVDLNGFLFMGLGFSYNSLTAAWFKGHGLHIFAYDGNAFDTRVERCGTAEYEALRSAPMAAADRADESNAITFHSVMTHNSFEKSWVIVGTKVNVLRVHDEALLTTVSVPSNQTGVEKRNGFGYYSAYFSSISGQLGTVSFSTFDSASTIKPVLTLGIINNSVGTIGAAKAIVSVISGDPGPRGGFIQDIISNEGGTLYIGPGARVGIGYMRTTDLDVRDSDSYINGGTADNVLSCSGVLSDVNVSGQLNVNTGGRVFRGASAKLTTVSVTPPGIIMHDHRVSGDASIRSNGYSSEYVRMRISGKLTFDNDATCSIRQSVIHEMDAATTPGLNVTVEDTVFDTANIPAKGVWMGLGVRYNVVLRGFTQPSGSAPLGRIHVDPNGAIWMCRGSGEWVSTKLTN